MTEEIRYQREMGAPKEYLDEIVVSGVDVHLEMMDRDHVWIGLSRGEALLHINIHVEGHRRPRLVVTTEDEGMELPVRHLSTHTTQKETP